MFVNLQMQLNNITFEIIIIIIWFSKTFLQRVFL